MNDWVNTNDMSKQKATANALPSQQAVNTLLANLRLLDLDREPDWPSIDAHILKSRDNGPNQKIRIQYAEWTLYRLIKIWDPTETEDVS